MVAWRSDRGIGHAGIDVDRASADFGTYPANQNREHVFVLKNNGDQPLKIIDIRKTCGCSETRLERNELAPGTTTKLTAVIKAGSIAGPFSKNLFVESNDSKQRFLMLLLNGNSVPLITVKPQDKIYVGTLVAGQEWQQEFVLETNQDKVEFERLVVKGGLVATTEIVALASRKFKLTVKIKVPPATGNFNLQLVLPIKAPAGWPAAEIFISGRWMPPSKK